MKKVLNKILGRLVLTSIIILLQLAWVAVTLYEAENLSPIVAVLLRIISLVIALYVVYKDMRPHNKLSWIFLILFLPIIGCPCYFLFGRSEMTKKTRRRMSTLQALVEPLRNQSEDAMDWLKNIDSTAYKQMSCPWNVGKYPVYMEQESKYYCTGDDMFEDMLQDIKKAEKLRIFL